jgi:hypothetical protein
MDGTKTNEVYRLILPTSIRTDAVRDLFHINVTRASLFPGLDGYAQMAIVTCDLTDARLRAIAFPRRTPILRTPLTRRMPAASSGFRRPASAAS